MPQDFPTNNDKSQVGKMFDDISGRYDLLNRLLSFRRDIVWRKKTVKTLSEFNSSQILDVATGTADLAIEMAKLKPERIIGIDISAKMLEIGLKKVIRANLESIITLQKTDVMQIPFPTNKFDIVSCAFGVRNFQFLEKGLKEISRVLKPGGLLAILEFSGTNNRILNIYLEKILPYIGKKISKHKSAYTYLTTSIKAFPTEENFIKILKKCYFKRVEVRKMNFGSVSLYLAFKQNRS